MKLTVYGDFNCPFSRLASHRMDLIIGTRLAHVEFRAVEHAPDIPFDGRAVVGSVRDGLAAEVDQVLALATAADGSFALRLPEVVPNTATMCRAYASTPSPELRRRLFDVVWSDEAVSVTATVEGTRRQAEWQAVYEVWEKRVVPSVVLEDGHVSRGLGGLKRLADLLD